MRRGAGDEATEASRKLTESMGPTYIYIYILKKKSVCQSRSSMDRNRDHDIAEATCPDHRRLVGGRSLEHLPCTF